MLQSNYTRVSVFVIVGFPGLHPSFYQLVAWFFFFIYVITVVGNILLVVLFALERSLQKPMYIIMLSLALSDIGFCTVALPKVIARYWWDDAGISFFLCLIQKQFIHYFGALTSLIMMTMAMDKYLAICYPLRYNELMTNRTMSLLTALSWVLAMISPAITTIQSSQMPFCGSNRINHCYCDTTSLNQLSCADISSQSRLSFSLAMVVLFLPFGFIVFSYVNIIFTVMRMANAQGRMKTFSTCATQGCIILIYYIPRFIVNATPYIPNLTTTPDLRISLAIFSSLLPPLLNPFIYCIRTKEIRAFLAKWANRGQSNAHHKPCIHPISSPLGPLVGKEYSMFEVNENYTRVSEFVIVGFPGLHPSFNQLVAWLFFFVYVITVVGNILLVVLFALERSLQKPMYIIMLSLALSDIGVCTVSLPKVIARYWWDDAGISFYTCLIQKQFIHYFGTLTSLIMMTMAMDRYLAICFPLRYTELMTNRTMSLLTALSWVSAMIVPGITTIQTSQMPFCGPNRIIHFYCNTVSMNQLSCADISSQSTVSVSLSMFVLFLPFSFIVFSYVNIIVSVMRMANAQSRWKTFSTCSSQLCIISLYYVPRCCVYTSSVINFSISQDLVLGLTLLYRQVALLPPLVNPFIYCIRTKEIRAFLAKWTNRGQSNAHHKPCIHPIAC
ncbi:uncharacterized protein LOC109873898 [Oncorhynchus kisutch]|uniref:uncharacterized protein LOC109873898 n=1 Tax=Oncorhynchus kisutch TaxID=8019 RepID=UPI0012DD3255|nr:uncharacterized protein LOC109873898 [Oncorhynchus kisutch]